MFNIGFPELALIFTAALLLLGPKKLPEFARWIGQAMRELRQATNEVRTAIDMELEREEFEKLQREFQDVVNTDLADVDHDPDPALAHEDVPHDDLEDFAPHAADQLAYPPMVDENGDPVPFDADATSASTDASDASASDGNDGGFVPPTGPPPGTISHGQGDFDDDEDAAHDAAEPSEGGVPSEPEPHTSAAHPTPDDYPETPIVAQSPDASPASEEPAPSQDASADETDDRRKPDND